MPSAPPETASPEALDPKRVQRFPRLQAVIAAALPGLLAGIQLAGLLFFLNPHLPFTPVPFLRAALLYSVLLSIASVVAHSPLIWRRPAAAWRALPWVLSAVFALASTIDWIHASYFAYYLPAGINRRLIRAAMWLTIAALIAFYTALLHSLNRRPYGLRSRTGLTLIAVLSVYVVIERREAFRPPPEITPRPSTVESFPRPQLVVVGLDTATLDAVLPLAEQGQLPFFATMLQQGAYGHLTSIRPPRRSPLWTTIATGKYPYQHGVVDNVSYAAPFLDRRSRLDLIPVGLGFSKWGTFRLPLPGDRRRALALWEILDRLDIATAVAAWPVPPDEPSPRLDLPSPPVRWVDGPLRSAGPAAPRDLRQLLVHDLQLEEWLHRRLAGAEDPATSAQALFVVLPGLRTISERYFGGYSAAQFGGRQEERYREAARVLAAYYAHLDAVLQRIWNDLPPPRLLAVVSAHGVYPRQGLRRIWATLSRQGALEGHWHGAPEGLILLFGEGIESGRFLSRASLPDVAPTLLYGLGFPVARDFDGSVLPDTFDASFLARNPLAFVPSYESFPPHSSIEPQGRRSLGGAAERTVP